MDKRKKRVNDKMKKTIKKLAKKSGFVFWGKEQWKPAHKDVAKIDWSCNYDKELKRFFKLSVKHAKKEVK